MLLEMIKNSSNTGGQGEQKINKELKNLRKIGNEKLNYYENGTK